MILRVAKGAWQSDIPQGLLSRAFAFCNERGASKLTSSYLSTEAEMEALLLNNGFEPFERYMPLTLDLTTFDPEQFAHVMHEAKLFTYAEAGDTVENRRRLYETEMAAKATQPFREVGEYVPQEFADWERELAQACHDTIFVASIDGIWVGLVRGLTWAFTGVRPEFRGRGIATALKIWSLTVAKQNGLTLIETENHEDNLAMRSINRKLGFVPGPVETNCARRFLFNHSSSSTETPRPLS